MKVKYGQRLTLLFLCLVLMVSLFASLTPVAYAEEPNTGCEIESIEFTKIEGEEYIPIGTITNEGSEYTITLPEGTSLYQLDKIFYLKFNVSTGASVKRTEGNVDWPAEGKQYGGVLNTEYHFTVTAEDGEHTKEYTVKLIRDPYTVYPKINNGGFKFNVNDADSWTVVVPKVDETGVVNNENSETFTSADVTIEVMDQTTTASGGNTNIKIGRIVINYGDRLLLKPTTAPIKKNEASIVSCDLGDETKFELYLPTGTTQLNSGKKEFRVFRSTVNTSEYFNYDIVVVGNNFVGNYPHDSWTVDESAKTITIAYDESIDYSAYSISGLLVPTWGVSMDKTVLDLTGGSDTITFTNAKGETAVFAVALQMPLKTGCEIESIEFTKDGESVGAITSDESAYTITLPEGTSLYQLDKIFYLKFNVSEGASVKRTEGNVEWPTEGKQYGGVLNTEYHFTVTAEDGEHTKEYTVKLIRDPYTVYPKINNGGFKFNVNGEDAWTIKVPKVDETGVVNNENSETFTSADVTIELMDQTTTASGGNTNIKIGRIVINYGDRLLLKPTTAPIKKNEASIVSCDLGDETRFELYLPTSATQLNSGKKEFRVFRSTVNASEYFNYDIVVVGNNYVGNYPHDSWTVDESAKTITIAYDENIDYSAYSISGLLVPTWGVSMDKTVLDLTGGSDTITFTNAKGDTAVFTVALAEPVQQHLVTAQVASLNLDGTIGVNFKMSLSESMLESDTVKAVFVYKGEEYPISVKGMSPNSDGYYVFTYYIPAKEFANTIGLKFVDGDETISMQYPSGNAVPNNLLEYSGQRYSESISSSSSAKALIDALRNYCAWAYLGLNDNVDIAPTFTEGHDESSITAAMLEPYKAGKTGSVTGLSLSSYSLTLETTTEVNLKFTLSSGHSIDEYTFLLEGKEATATQDGKYWIVVIPDIAAKDLDTMYTLQVTNGTETMTVTCSGLSYGYTVLKNNLLTENMQNTIRALYLYNKEANTFFND